MDARNARPLKTKPPGYIEVSIDDATDYFLPYDDQHVMFSFRQYICINGARFSPGEVVILMWKNGREVRGQYAGSCILPKKGRLHYLRLMPEEEYRKWESEITAWNRKLLYGDRDAATMHKIREEIRLRLSQQADNFTDFID